MTEKTVDINFDNIAGLARMYAAFLAAAYKELVKAGYPEELANQTAMAILEKHMQASTTLAAKKNQSLQDLLASMPTKGGTS